MRRASALALSVVGLVLASAHDACAERVVLMRPEPSDAVLFDAWNRLAAELRIHHFEAETVESGVGEAPETVLAAEAEKRRALAAIALVRHGRDASVDVWLVDRGTGKTTLRTLVVEGGADAASVLAFRAVDLLRASLREFARGEAPPKDVARVDRRAPTPAREAFTAAPEPALRLRADALLFVERGAGVAAGPSLSVSYRVSDRFELGVAGAGPIVGGRTETALGAATLQQELAWCDLRFAVFRGRPLDVGVNAALGAYFLGAEGEPAPPLRARSGHLVAALAGIGVHAELAVTPSFGAGVAVRVVAVAPRAGVAVGTAAAPLELPAVVASAGIRVSL
jgi:hypothetical protein